MDINSNGKSDFQEVEDGFAQLFSDVKAGNVSGVLTDLKNGVAWTVNEIEALESDAQAFLSAAVSTVKAEASSVDDAVSRVLTIVNDPGLQAKVGLVEQSVASLKSLSSSAIASAVGVVKATAAQI